MWMLVVGLMAAMMFFPGITVTQPTPYEKIEMDVRDTGSTARMFMEAANLYVSETETPTAIINWPTIQTHHRDKGRGGYIALKVPSNWTINGNGTDWAICLPFDKMNFTNLKAHGDIKWTQQEYITHGSFCP